MRKVAQSYVAVARESYAPVNNLGLGSLICSKLRGAMLLLLLVRISSCECIITLCSINVVVVALD